MEEGLAETRARAQAVILGGGATVEGIVVTQPSTLVHPGNAVKLVSEPIPYVSRGGLKLEKALDEFDITLEEAIALDVGASTGGFTDVLLQRGARGVFCVDVGYGQLAWTLRQDPRVTVLERTNIRSLDRLPERPALAVVDVSFISLRLVLPHVSRLLEEDGTAVVLIKPQFEAGRKQVGKKGVVRDPLVWAQCLRTVLGFAVKNDWQVMGLVRSPIEGRAGNVEFLAHLRRGSCGQSVDLEREIEHVIAAGR